MYFMAVKKSRKRSVFVIYSYTVFKRKCIYSQLKGIPTNYVCEHLFGEQFVNRRNTKYDIFVKNGTYM